MSATTLLFDRYKVSLRVRSDRQAAMVLGVKVQTVSNWRTRGSQAEATTIEAMCRQLQEDPMPWLLRAQAEQGRGSANGLVWQRVATRLGVSLSALALLVDAVMEFVLSGAVSAAGASSNVFAFALPAGQAITGF